MPKLTFDEVIERLNDEKPVNAIDVQPKALNRKIWLAQNGLPGCMPDHSGICLTKTDAIDECVLIADNGEGFPDGLKSGLKKNHIWYDPNGYMYKIEQVTLREIL